MRRCCVNAAFVGGLVVLAASLMMPGCRPGEDTDDLPLTVASVTVDTDNGRMLVIYGFTGHNQPRQQTPMLIYPDSFKTGEAPPCLPPSITWCPAEQNFVVSVNNIEQKFSSGCVIKIVARKHGFELAQVADSWDRRLFLNTTLLEEFIKKSMAQTPTATPSTVPDEQTLPLPVQKPHSSKTRPEKNNLGPGRNER